MSRRPRLAVITTEIGIRSEVWMLRQLAAFTRVEPLLFGWTTAAAPLPLPPGLEWQHFTAGDPRAPTAAQRIARRLGLASGHLPGPAVRQLLWQQLAAARVDAVLCHFAWNAIPIVASVAGRLPVFAQVHGRDVSQLMARASYCRALERTLPRLDLLAAVGRFQIDRLRPLGLPPAWTVIPCGAPTALFGAAPLPERAAGQPIRFASVGRISSEKGVRESLSAFEMVVASGQDAELVYVGEGPDAAALDAAIAASPARARITRLGYVAPEALAGVLAGCHVLVQHSRTGNGWIEGFGVTLTEAGAAGLALVASNSGGIPDQVTDGHNGFLFDEGDIVAQAAAMQRLAADEGLRRRMGAAARTVALGFDATAMALKLEDAMLAAIARRAA